MFWEGNMSYSTHPISLIMITHRSGKGLTFWCCQRSSLSFYSSGWVGLVRWTALTSSFFKLYTLRNVRTCSFAGRICDWVANLCAICYNVLYTEWSFCNDCFLYIFGCYWEGAHVGKVIYCYVVHASNTFQTHAKPLWRIYDHKRERDRETYRIPKILCWIITHYYTYIYIHFHHCTYMYVHKELIRPCIDI